MSTTQSDCFGQLCPNDPIFLAELREIARDKRLKETEKWTSLLKLELKFNISQAHDLLELKERVNLMLQNIYPPLAIAQENVFTRRQLKGSDKIEDTVEEILLRGVDIFQHSDEILLEEIENLNMQLQNLRAIRHEIEVDIESKKDSHGSDECIKLLHSILYGTTQTTPDRSSPSKQALGSPENSVATQSLIKKSQAERNASLQLYTSVTRKLIKAADSCFDAWYETNVAFEKQIQKITQAKEEVEEHLQENKHRIKKLKCQQAKIENYLNDKRRKLQLVLQLIQMKFEKRREDSTDVQLCRDNKIFELLREIQNIKSTIEKLTERNDSIAHVLDEMATEKAKLERKLKLKFVALRTERDKCLLLRQSYPISTFVDTRFPTRIVTIGRDATAFTSMPAGVHSLFSYSLLHLH